MSDVAGFFNAVGQAFADYPRALQRNMDRFSQEALTRKHLFRDVRKIKDVPVDGDTIAQIARGDRS